MAINAKTQTPTQMVIRTVAGRRWRRRRGPSGKVPLLRGAAAPLLVLVAWLHVLARRVGCFGDFTIYTERCACFRDVRVQVSVPRSLHGGPNLRLKARRALREQKH